MSVSTKCLLAAGLLAGAIIVAMATNRQRLTTPMDSEQSGLQPDRVSISKEVAAERRLSPISGIPIEPADDASRPGQLSDEQLIEYGINPDMREWAFRFLADRMDQEYLKEFFLLRAGVTDAATECLQVVMPDGESIEHCEGGTSHHYFEYANEALEQLALADPIAAQVLGHRNLYEDPDASEAYFLRAAALSGKPGPIIDYLGLYGGLLGEPGSDKLLNEEAALRGYTLAIAVNRIGYPLLISRHYRRALEDHGVSEARIAAAEVETNQILEQMEQTRTALIGGNL